MKQVGTPIYSALQALEVGVIIFRQRRKQVKIKTKRRKGANPTHHKHSPRSNTLPLPKNEEHTRSKPLINYRNRIVIFSKICVAYFICIFKKELFKCVLIWVYYTDNITNYFSQSCIIICMKKTYKITMIPSEQLYTWTCFCWQEIYQSQQLYSN